MIRPFLFSHDLKEHKGSIIVPAYDVNGKLWTLQFIDQEGNKRFLSGGKKKGSKKAGGFDIDKKAMMQMMGGFTLLRLTSLMAAV